MKRIQPLLTRLVSALSLLCIVASGPEAAAQSAGASQAFRDAQEAYGAGDLEKASQGFSKLIADYPTDLLVPSARIQLASVYFIQSEFDKALASLEAFFKSPVQTPELKQAATLLQAQILSAKASSLPVQDAARKSTYEQAAAKFAEFLKEFPNASPADIESATYGRAFANFQAGNIAEAIKDLEGNLQRFANSPTILDSQNLLALALATQGSQKASADPSGPGRAEGIAEMQKAADLLRDIINKRTDLTLVNAANFQLGDILLNLSSYATGEERATLLRDARSAFRSVVPREDLIAIQKRKLESFPQRRREAIQRNDQNALRNLDREIERERRKLAELEGRPDQVVQALLKTGEVYFIENRHDEARTVFNRVRPFLESENDKKRELYFTTLTYALQSNAEKAVNGYDQFQAKYKGDPLASNLPAALGNMFLNGPQNVRDPEKAIAFFKESVELYPNGPLKDVSIVSQASAQIQLKQYEDALRTFQSSLQSNPSPEVALIAEKGIADIYRDTKRWDEAIAAYKKIAEKFASNPAAVTEAEYWVAICTQQKGDNAGAIPLLKAFIEKNPDGPFTPVALYTLAAAQIATGDKAAGIESMTQIAEKFPNSQPAPFTYFQRAQLYAAEGKADQVESLMRQFIEKYPQDEKVYFAYDSLGQAAVNAGDMAKAAEIYREFSEKYAGTPRAAEALLKLADLQRTAAERLGRYGALNSEEQGVWKKHITDSTATLESLFEQYPDSPSLALGLQSMLKIQKLLIQAREQTPEGVSQYFNDLAGKFSTPAGRSKTLFTLATYIAETDKQKALEIMQEAYDPSVLYAPADLDFYGIALLDNGKPEEGAAVFEKLAADYPVPANIQPQQAPPQIQEAQASALFGRARVAQLQGNTAQAGELFKQLKTLYPWSPKIYDADFGIAEALVEQGKYDEALPILTQIIRATNAQARLRARAMFLGGEIMEKKGDIESAIDYYLKIPQFYEAVSDVSSEALWKGAQLLEKQAAGIAEAAKKQQQLNKAIQAYKDLVTNYPDSTHAAEAQERLKALGAR